MSAPTAPTDKPFADDPPIARAVRKLDSYIGLGEQVVLFCLLMFLMFVAVLSFAMEHIAGTHLENASYDIRYTCFLIAMVGGAFAAHHRRLLAMDVVSHWMHGKLKAYVKLTTTVFALFMACVFFKYGLYIYELTSAERATSHWMPPFAANGAMMIGAFLLAVHLLAQVIIDVDYIARGKLPPEQQMGAI